MVRGNEEVFRRIAEQYNSKPYAVEDNTPPVRSGHNEIVKRKCLNCYALFTARSKYIRLCDRCKRNMKAEDAKRKEYMI